MFRVKASDIDTDNIDTWVRKLDRISLSGKNTEPNLTLKKGTFFFGEQKIFIEAALLRCS